MDAYDNMYKYRLRDIQMDKTDLEPVFQCRKGGKFKGGVALSGRVEHHCMRCDHVVTQTWVEYRTMFQRGGIIEVDCPLVVMYRERKKRG